MEGELTTARWLDVRQTLRHAGERVESWLSSGALSFDPRFRASLGSFELSELRFLDALYDRLGDSPAFTTLAQRLQRPVRFDYGEVAFCFATDTWIPCSPAAARLEPAAAHFDFAAARNSIAKAASLEARTCHDRAISYVLGQGFLPDQVLEQLIGLERVIHSGLLEPDLRRIARALEDDLDDFQSLVDRVSDLRDRVPSLDCLRQLLSFFEGTKIPGRARPLATRALFAAAPRCFVPLDHEWSMRAILGLSGSSKAFHSDDPTIAASEYQIVLQRAHDIASAEPAEVGRLLAIDPCSELDTEGLAIKSWPRVLDRLARLQPPTKW